MTSPKRRLRPVEIALFVVPLCGLAFATWRVWDRDEPFPPFVPPHYSVADLGSSGAAHRITDINDKGEIVGAWGASSQMWRPVLWKNGKMQFLDTRTGSAEGINNKGSVIIDFETSNQTSAFLWNDRKLRKLGTLGGDESYASDINDKDEIVGFADAKQDDKNRSHAFLWQNGAMRDISGTNNTFNIARAINQRGDIVGVTQTSQACLWKNDNLSILPNSFDARDISNKGTILGQGDKISMEVCWWKNGRKKTILSETGFNPLSAKSINDNDQVVGSTVIKNSKTGVTFAFLYTNDQIYDLNTLLAPNRNYRLFIAYAINNRGQIVCEGIFNAKRHIFLLTPITSRVPQQSSTR